MLEAIKALAERSVMERLVLLVNHVIAAEPVALDRLRPHAARTMQIELTGWPALLPAVGPFAFRVSPAGLVEWLPEASSLPPDLRVAIDAANPALAFTRIVAGERPAITVSGDAAFASDIDWLIDNLRWDLQDDLARVIGDAPAPRPRAPRPRLRQVRPGAVDTTRPAAARHRRRARPPAGPRAAVSGGRRAGDRREGVRPSARRDLRQLRRRAGGERLDRAGALRRPQGRSRGRRQGAAPGHVGGDRRRRRGDAPGRARRRALVGRRQAAQAAPGR